MAFRTGQPVHGGSPRASRPLWGRLGRVVTVLCVGYLCGLLGTWIFFTSAPATNWIANLLLFGPRWVLALPLILLVPLTAVRPRNYWILLASTLLLLGPVMGGCIPWRTWLRGDASGKKLKVMSFNMLGDKSDAFLIGEYIVRESPDLVLFVESGSSIRSSILWRGAWHVERDNEITLASRYPILSMEPKPHPDIRYGGGARFLIDVDGSPMMVYGLHLTTPRDGFEAAVQLSRDAPEIIRSLGERKEREARRVKTWMEGSRDLPTLAMGDFNLPEESPTYRENFGHLGNSFTEAGFGLGRSFFTKWFGVRIDHILHDGHWRAERCWVGPDLKSDHRPVLAELRWIGGPGPEPGSDIAADGDRRDP